MPLLLFPWEKAPGTNWIGGWVGPRPGLDNVEKRKIWPYRDLNSDPSVVQLVASRYTDYAILAFGVPWRQQAEVVQNNENVNVRDIGRDEAQRRKY
jgi:hypothetical protein